jgi:hypothetical protein
VRLTYRGGWQGRPIVPFTGIIVGEQAATRGPGYLYDLLLDAGSLLVYAADREHWPAELRPAAEQPPGAPT